MFDYFISHLRTSIKTWDYFVNWQKVNNNHSSVELELNTLNYLIGKDENIKDEFIALIKKQPAIIKTFPILLAVRENRLEILKDYEAGDLSYLNFDFSEKNEISETEAKKIYSFFEKSGIKDLFMNKRIENFVDYVYGVEVGLDSNGRKNRGGKLMENIVEVFVNKIVKGNKALDYLPQATPKKIKAKWGFEVKFNKSARSFDFAVYDSNTKKIYLIEANFYNGGGSKLKSVCGEFKSLHRDLAKQNIDFIWVTDGKGWESTKRPLEETFNNNYYVLNLNLIENGALKEILN
mgnify:CR=1 FL=1